VYFILALVNNYLVKLPEIKVVCILLLEESLFRWSN